MRPNIFFIFLLLLLLPYYGYSQDSTRVNVQARVQKDAILLRWAANTPMAWQQSNRHGFRLERYTVVRDDKVLPRPEEKLLATVKALPLNEWESIAQTNDYAAIIAQALYGDSFELDGEGVDGIACIITLSQDLEQRFTFSLYAADQNFEAACMAGWGWRDTDVKPNERYLYRIIPNLPEGSSYKIEMGSVYVSLNEYEELPKPIGLTALFGDKSVLLAWDYGILSSIYNSYYIEKSSDGNNFARMDGVPVVNLNNKENQQAERMYYIDSLANNQSTFYYRVVGITAFGEIGSPSEAISGKGKDQFSYVPYITRAVVNDNGQMEMEWRFDENGNRLIKGFELNHSDNPDNSFKVVASNIAPNKRSLVFDKLNASNYFTISAIPFEGQPAISFPVLVQPVDSIPPAIPTGLKGIIDSTGLVTLTWNRNIEFDMYGYKVYRAHVKGEELMPLFDIALQDNVFVDTIDVLNLNRHVYYAISAVDMRYNQSDQTPVLELEKPDLLQPSAPVISGYKIDNEGITIEWVNSPDDGVIQHRLYRRKKGENHLSLELLVAVTDKAIQRYTDTSAVTNVHYMYTVTALKNKQLESEPSNVLTAFTNKPKTQEMLITGFDAIVDKENRMLKLLWKDNIKNVKYYEIYKGDNVEGISLWKKLPSSQKEVLDEKLYINTTYQYLIRAILDDGRNTKFKELTIKY